MVETPSLILLAAVAAVSLLLAWGGVALARRRGRTGWPWSIAVLLVGIGSAALGAAPTTLELAIAAFIMSTGVAAVPLLILFFVPTVRRA